MAPDADSPIAYIERTRTYYAALGYERAYEWARFETVPFERLRLPLEQARITLVTTAAPFRAHLGPQGPGAPYNARAKFFDVYSASTAVDHDVRIAHLAIDRRHTSMQDSGTWFPLPAMRRLHTEHRLLLAQRFHGMPTNRSQRHTIDHDAAQLLARCREDGVDAALLVANCPVCHQSLALAARHLEANGISTVVLGCARDIVEMVGVARFLFSDFPLGNAAGRPLDLPSQSITLELALDLLVKAPGPRSTVQSPLIWSRDASWKRDYGDISGLCAEDIAALRAQHEEARRTGKSLRTTAEPHSG